MSTDLVSPEAWPAAKGYANGRIGHGNVLEQPSAAMERAIAVAARALGEPTPYGA